MRRLLPLLLCAVLLIWPDGWLNGYWLRFTDTAADRSHLVRPYPVGTSRPLAAGS